MIAALFPEDVDYSLQKQLGHSILAETADDVSCALQREVGKLIYWG